METAPPTAADPIVDEVREIAGRLGLARRYRELDRHPEFPWKEFRGLGEAGLIGLRTSPALGGRGLPLPRVGIGLFHLAYRSGTAFAKLSGDSPTISMNFQTKHFTSRRYSQLVILRY